MLIEKTQLDQDIDALQNNVNTSALAVSALASTLNNAHAEFWMLPDDRLLGVLNKLGPEKAQLMFDEHYSIAFAANAFMDATGVEGTRAIAVRGRTDIDLVDGVFVVIPPAAVNP